MLLGDFNIDALKYTSSEFVSTYIDSLFSSGFLQTITKPTRCTNRSATLIDHAITNISQDSFTNIILTTKISDHFPIIIFSDKPSIKPLKTSHTFRNFSAENVHQFNQNLSNLDWDSILSNDCANSAFDSFHETFSTLHDLHFHPKTVKFNINYHKIEKWMTKGLLISRSTKNRLDAAYAKKPTEANKLKYISYRNVYNSVIRACKKLHFSKAITNNARNLKKTWCILNEAINRPKSTSSITSIIHNNSLITDPTSIANSFNEFFTNIALKIAEQIHPSAQVPEDIIQNLNPDSPSFNMSEVPVSDAEILEAIKKLEDKKTPDMSGLSSHLLKKIGPSILPPLQHIFTLSLRTGIVPSKLKIAKVIPLFKSGDCLDMNNYRPISLLSSFSKILEKIVHARLYFFLDSNSLITPNQFGFRPNHSTSHPMTLLLNKVTSSLNSKLYSIIIFCDLKKAFDTCNHNILLKKLSSLGINGIELAWFKSYLTDRLQFVTIDNVDSVLLTILTGVPQGSILGPLLFLIYINDLPNCTTLLSQLFADDTALSASSADPLELFAFVNRELHKLCTYFRTNMLSLHPDKTKFLLISPSSQPLPQNLKIFINNNNCNENNPSRIHELTSISPSDNIPAIKYLGVYFDPQLTFKYHLSQISKKLSYALYSLRSVKNLLPPHSLKTLYYSLFHCHLVYGIETWSSAAPSLLKPLFTKQKMAVRILANKPYNAHTEPLFKSLEILPLSDLISFFKLKFFHSFVYNTIPSSFASTWLTSLEQRQQDGQLHLLYNLRNNDDFFIPFVRTAFLSRFPLYNFPDNWNNLPHAIKDIPSKNFFSSTLKKYLLSKLNANFTCNRLICHPCITAGLN